MSSLIKPTPRMHSLDCRRFLRRMRASDMKAYLKTGCDMGWYGHFVSLVKIDTTRLKKVLNQIREDMRYGFYHG